MQRLMQKVQVVVLVAFAAGVLAAPLGAQSIVAEGAELKLLADDFTFTEGPATDGKGNVYFTDQPNDAIHVWTVAGELETFLQPAGRSNGLYFAEDGTLWACADEHNQLWAIAPDGKHQPVVVNFEGKLLNGPNDLWIHSQRWLFFTDPFYKRPYWPADRGPKAQPSEAVYRLDRNTGQVTRMADQFKRPNGIIGDADRGVLYVADIGANKTYRFKIAEDGTLQQQELFCAQGSDGMTIDRQGNVYLTGGQGVSVYSSAGEKLEVIAVPERWTANVTFGGANHDTLFITASDSLYSIRTRMQGI